MLQQISESEMEIMQIIWKKDGSISFAPLMEAVQAKGKVWKQNTVLTFLVRLTEKGYITATKTGRTKQYAAAISESAYMEEQANIFLHKVYGGNVKGLVSALLKQQGITEEDFLELRSVWKKGGNTNE